MKILYCLIFVLLPASLFAQDAELDKKVQDLKIKISNSEKGEKLKWLDSLLVLIEFNEDREYSKTAAKALDIALKLDSLNAAGLLYAEIAFHKMHILQQPEQALEVLKDFNSKKIEEEKIDPEHIGDLYMYSNNQTTEMIKK